MKKLTGLLLVIGLVTSLVGCDKASKMAQDLQNQAKESLQKAQDDVVDKGPTDAKAISSYIDAENTIIGMGRFRGGLGPLLSRYKKQKLSEATAKKRNPDTEFSASSMASIVEDLKTASSVDLKGDYAGLDKTGKALYAAAVPFEKTLKEMDTYLTSKAYMEDDFAKGKELDPVLIKQAEAFIEAYEAFSKESSKVEVLRNNSLVRNLKSNGKMAEAYGYEAYGYIMQFLTIATEEDVKDPAVVEKLDGLIKSTDETLAKMKEKVEKPREDLRSSVKSAMDDEFKLLGKMREAKSKNYRKSSLSSFVDAYNHFVQFTLNMGGLSR